MKTVFPAVSASKLSWVSSMALAPEAAAARPTNRAVNFMVVIALFFMRSQISTEAGLFVQDPSLARQTGQTRGPFIAPMGYQGDSSPPSPSSSFFFNLSTTRYHTLGTHGMVNPKRCNPIAVAISCHLQSAIAAPPKDGNSSSAESSGNCPQIYRICLVAAATPPPTVVTD